MADRRERSIEIAGRDVPVRVQRNPRAKRLILRLDPGGDGLVLTLPRGVAIEEGFALIRREERWVARRLGRAKSRVPFTAGVEVPYLGTPHPVRHAAGRRGTVWVEDGEILVAGSPEHLPRRLADWFRREARGRIEPLAHRLAGELDRRCGRITVRDTRSRWGSCTSQGNLNFSYRLVMAPEHVLHYVVAHEVAHLAEHNHSAAFWAVVEQLDPAHETARAWLRAYGEDLHRYG